MDQIKAVWQGLEMRQRIALGVGLLLMILTIAVMSRIATRPGMSLLYAGLEGPAAGEVMAALDQRSVQYDVRGDTIFVPSAERDALRLALAGEGLPDTGTRGYELLDNLTGFGTTSQMFDAAYWRAKEGELARTIVANPQISHARVHIANVSNGPFSSTYQPSASVSVTHAGIPITPMQANAVRYLVASAVAGLSPDNVTVIDASGSLISSNQAESVASAADGRSQVLRERVLRMLEARVGPGNAVVEVSVETVSETESFRERLIDPEGRVAVSSDIEERNDQSSDAGGEVTVASNLPDGEGAGGNQGSSNATSTRERVNYEVSESEREVLRGPGDIRRLTVAVLVNGLTSEAGFEPRPQAELDALQELVASAVGFNETRGDVITLKSMPFPESEIAGTGSEPGMFRNLSLDLTAILQLLVLAGAAALVARFVLKPILAPSSPEASLTLAAPGVATAGTFETLAGEVEPIDSGDFAPLNLGMGPEDAQALPSDPATGSETVDRLKDLIGDRQDETVEILRNWLEESREEA